MRTCAQLRASAPLHGAAAPHKTVTLIPRAYIFSWLRGSKWFRTLADCPFHLRTLHPVQTWKHGKETDKTWYFGARYRNLINLLLSIQNPPIIIIIRRPSINLQQISMIHPSTIIINSTFNHNDPSSNYTPPSSIYNPSTIIIHCPSIINQSIEHHLHPFIIH